MSKNNEIAVSARNTFGKNASRRSRRDGIVPAVVYSKKNGSRAIELSADDWKVLSGHHVQMVTLVEGQKKIHALVKEVQFNHLKNYVVHIDFQEVDMHADITAMVAIKAHGDCIGVVRGGILEQELHELEVICHADKLPESIIADVSELQIGDALTVAALTLPEGVRTGVDPEHVIFHVVRPKEEAEPAAADGEAPAEPEAIKEKKREEEPAQ